MNINVKALKQKIDSSEKIALIDVRESYEHEEFNIGGTLIPIGDLPMKISDIDIEKDAEIVVYCRSGNRSGMGQFVLREAGFTNVYNLEGGMLAWQEAFGGWSDLRVFCWDASSRDLVRLDFQIQVNAANVISHSLSFLKVDYFNLNSMV